MLGTPEGLAVFQNGVRINEPFGDAVNWDLVPDSAVRRVDVVSANPVYGLNALGGAVVVSMKDGFDDPGASLALSGGSWGRHGASAEFGGSEDQWGYYAAAQYDAQDGWRDFSPDAVLRGYGALSWHSETASIDLTLTLADNRLDGELPAPVQELAVDRALVFTNPQSIRNRLVFPALDFTLAPTAAMSVSGAVYYRGFRQTAVNGNTTGYEACTALAGELCQPDGMTPLSDERGNSVPDLSQGGRLPIGEIDSDTIATGGAGATLAATDTARFSVAIIISCSVQASTPPRRSSVPPRNRRRRAVIAGRRLGPFPRHAGRCKRHRDAGLARGADARHRRLRRRHALGHRRAGAFAERALQRRRYRARRSSRTGARRACSLRPLQSGGGADLCARRRRHGLVGYAGGNRTPTPDELECADPAAPCVLPSSLSSDPPLKEVVSRSVEAGLRGRLDLFADGLPLSWRADLFPPTSMTTFTAWRHRSPAAISAISAVRDGRASTSTCVMTACAGAVMSLRLCRRDIPVVLLMPSPYDAGADTNGNISVRPGDSLPGIPRQRVKIGAEYRFDALWSAGFGVVLAGSQYFRGDEANELARRRASPGSTCTAPVGLRGARNSRCRSPMFWMRVCDFRRAGRSARGWRAGCSQQCRRRFPLRESGGAAHHPGRSGVRTLTFAGKKNGGPVAAPAVDLCLLSGDQT